MMTDRFAPRPFFMLAALVLFFNRVLLPFGLQYSLLLTPFLLYFLVKAGKAKEVFGLCGVFATWSLVHLSVIVSLPAALLSFALLCATIIFALSVFQRLVVLDSIAALFRWLAKVNALLLAVACLVYPFEQLRPLCWYLNEFTPNHVLIPRLKIFELEAAHYSMTIVPLVLYFVFKVLKRFQFSDFLLLCTLIASLVLSFSFGVLSCLVLTFLLLFVLRLTKIYQSFRLKWFFLAGIGSTIVACIFLFVIFPDNPLFFRLNNVLTGVDTSGRGRTYEAFILAQKILQSQEASAFGIGLGQLKIVGRTIIIQYYSYTSMPDVVRLPNSTAEFMVYYGYVGLALRLAVQVYCFFRFRVHQDVYKMSVFLFVFVYQFTGSYIFNPMEYVLWALAFAPYPSRLTFKSFTVQ